MMNSTRLSQKVLNLSEELDDPVPLFINPAAQASSSEKR
jgi:hypothetical protein